MKKTIALVLALVMVLTCAVAVGAAGSKSSSGGGGGSAYVTGKTAYTGSTVSQGTATTTATGASAAAAGDWSQNADGTWNFNQGGKKVAATWALVQNPYAGNAGQWFYFDANGTMLTGWVWIKGADGVTRCYYLNPTSNGSKGACYLNGTTPDGYTVDASGAWTVNGVVQTK